MATGDAVGGTHGKTAVEKPAEHAFSKKDDAPQPVTNVADLAKRSSDEYLKARARKLSIREGSAYSIMDGFGLRYITPYALALGATTTHIGLLTSMPSFLGNISQLATHKLMERTSRKRIVVAGVFCQAVMWLVLLGLGWLYFTGVIGAGMAAGLLVVGYTLFTLFGAITGPAWASWMKDVVTINPGKYFGTRNRICGAIAIVCMLIAGWVLDYFKTRELIIGFTILFGLSVIGRSVSGFTFTRAYEPRFTPRKDAYFSLWQFVKRMAGNNFGRFVLLVALTNFAVNIGGPFIAVYWLKELKFSYITYTIIGMINPLFSLIMMPVWGKFADRYGNLTTIKLCMPFIALLPLLYATSPLILKFMPSLLLVFYVFFEIMSGVAWAGFNLCVMNFVYDAVTRDRTALCIAYLNVLAGFGVLVGATIGGYVASLPPIFGVSALIVVMVISGVARFGVFLLVQPFVHEVREVRKMTMDEMKEKLIHLTPSKMLRLLDVRT